MRDRARIKDRKKDRQNADRYREREWSFCLSPYKVIEDNERESYSQKARERQTDRKREWIKYPSLHLSSNLTLLYLET